VISEGAQLFAITQAPSFPAQDPLPGFRDCWIMISSSGDSEATVDHDLNLGWDKVHGHS